MFEQKISTSKDIVELVNLLDSNYEMFFGSKKDIYNLYFYILGYVGARIESNTSLAIDEKFQFDFNTWFYKKYLDKLEHSTYWAKAIDLIYESDDEKIEAFFSHFWEFISEVDTK